MTQGAPEGVVQYVSHPPAETGLRRRSSALRLRVMDALTAWAATGGALLLIGLLVLLVGVVAAGAWPAVKTFGVSFLTRSGWNPVKQTFGAWPYVYSTLVTSVVALVMAVPVSVGTALFLTKLAPRMRFVKKLVGLASFLVELLAAIPSIAYGLWGIAVLVPLMQKGVQPALAKSLGNLPWVGELFAKPASGFNLLSASVVLAIMVTPIVTAIVRDVLSVSPPELEQGALGLGATWWQSQKLVLGYSKLGIFGAVILGLARAMGETMAVTMIIGNAAPRGYSLFSSGQTISSELANQFNNADTDGEKQALLYLALVLLAITMVINGVARVILLRVTSGKKRR